MNVPKIIPKLNRNNLNSCSSRAEKSFQLQKTQNTTKDNILPNFCPAYFNPSFGLKNPKSALLRAQKLKEFYNSKGLPYLLPSEVWSNKKIFEAVDLLGKDLDELGDSKNLNKQSVQKAVNKLLPDNVKGKVLIKDFTDLETDLRQEGYSEDEIKMYLRSGAIALDDRNSSTLYFKFFNAILGKGGVIGLKSSIEHEVIHALGTRFQNIKMADLLKNNYGKHPKQLGLFNTIFSVFEGSYNPKLNMSKVKLTEENMLKWVGFDSIEDLHNSFGLALKDTIANIEFHPDLDIRSDRTDVKNLFGYIKHASRDEKQAYRSNIRFRELTGDLDSPVDAEFKPLLYAEMEKFFANLERSVNVT